MSLKSNNEIDMLHGPLLMKILIFSLPLAASSIMQQLFNSIDVAVVGRFVSSEALAAVGSNSPVISLMINLFLGISMGANVVISNHIGQHDPSRIRNAVNTIGMVSVICGVFLMIIGILAARPILTVMGTPAEVLDMAVLYLRIFFLGVPFFIIFDFGAAILRSIGDTRRPLYVLMISGVVNACLCLIFVLCFHIGVAGVAVATGIANAVSAFLIIRILLNEKEPYRLHLNELCIHWDELKRMLMIGVPAGLQGMIFSFSNVLLQTAINSHGANAIAGSAAALNFEYYCYYVISAFNGAAITFIGQNYGAGNKERVMRIYWISMGLSTLICCAFNELFTWQHDFFLGLFTGDPSVKEYGNIRLHCVLALQFLACSYEVSSSALRGMGVSLLPTVLTLFGTCLLRIIWVYAVCPVWNSFEVIMYIYPISWIATGLMVCIAFYITVRKKLKMLPDKVA